jgi:CBS domain containing-hemolysin-like protein
MLVFSAFFSGMEIAFLSSNRLRIEVEKKQGGRSSRLISIFLANPKKYIATMLVGNNIALVVYGIMMSVLLEPVFEKFIHSETGVLLLQTLVSTMIILITAEFLPKTIFLLNSNLFLKLFAFPVFVFYVIFYPFSWASIKFSNFILKHFFKARNTKTPNIVFGKVDLDDYINAHLSNHKDQVDEGYELKIFQNALDFSKVKLRECMIPRTEIVALPINEPITKLQEKFIETGFSKILIFQENIDDIIGYVHSSRLFNKPSTIEEVMMDVLIVPESMPANKLLSLFIQEQRSIAVVVDEFGGTSGMATIEDIMEEIFGEISDEHDTEDYENKKISDTEFIFSGRLEIDALNEKHEIDLPDVEGYETIAGLILHYHENIPKVNEIVTIDKFQFRILKSSNTRIELVSLKIIQPD